MARGLLVGIACVALARPAQADASAECERAFSEAPELARTGQLRAARGALVRCSSQSCPSSMAQLCTEDLRQLEARVPSVVFAAVDPRGADVLEARVSEDGKVLAAPLDGRAVELDPGPHRFRFEGRGYAPIDVAVVIREGDKLRAIRAAFTNDAPPAPPMSPPVTREPTRPIPWTVIAAAGVAVAATGAFAYFGVRGLNERSDLDSCRGSCSHDAIETAKTHLIVADVFLAAAVVGYAVAGVLFFNRPAIER